MCLLMTVFAFWDGQDAHQPQTGAAKQRIVREANVSVAWSKRPHYKKTFQTTYLFAKDCFHGI